MVFLVGRSKKLSDSVRLSVVMSKAQAERIKHMAIRMSTKEGRVVTVSEAIRSVIEAAYPVPKGQADLFS